ncbi:MAG: TPM domain-containing protein [Ignavibacteriae bacterium]|nr:TPM domain-containing protein [Ignavibacteriota bacterium]
MRRAHLFFSLTVACLLIALAAARALDVPYLGGRINDLAHILSTGTIEEIERLLKAHEDSTGNQFAVLTITTLEGESLEEYALRVAETWKLGKKGSDNGALLLIAKDDRKLRIEVGYGLEASLTDAVCSFIINEKITPEFKNGNFDAGVLEGVRAMIAAADGTLDTSTASSSADGFDTTGMIFFLVFWMGIVGVFTFLGIFSKGCTSWFMYAFLIPFWAAPALILLDSPVSFLGPVFFLVYIIGFPLLKLLAPKTEWGRYLTTKVTTSRSSGGWMSSSSSGGGWSSGGSSFSGGGGSFGGGGSSGSW